MKLHVLLTAALLSAPALAVSQSAAPGMTYEQFNHIDKDGSGTISETEYFQFMEGAFKELDADRNNSLSPEETDKLLTRQQFSQVDANGNGRLSRQEFLDHVMNDFRRHDSDGDGQLHP